MTTRRTDRTNTSTVLILTSPFDTTSDYVVAELTRRGRSVFRCDPGDFPINLSFSACLVDGWSGKLHNGGRELALTDVGHVYYRRPTTFMVSDELTAGERRWTVKEDRFGLGGVLSSLPHWLNHPWSIASAEYKPVQLSIARSVGLTVPPTIVTNEPEVAREFVSEVGEAVYKTLSACVIDEGSTEKLIYTSRVAAADIDDSVAGAAHLFQAWVPKAYEARVVVVDDAIFSIRIDTDSPGAALDWRRDYDHLRYSVTEIPNSIGRSVHRLLTRMRLRFAAIDFVIRPNGEWVFLEINPNGQWAWLQDATGVDIASALADALTFPR